MMVVPSSLSLHELHDCIDWSCSFVGGSFALRRFAYADWIPGNIDVFVVAQTADDFWTRRDTFVRAMRERDPRCMLMLSENVDCIRQPAFAPSITATSLMHFCSQPLPIKMWGVAVSERCSLLSHVTTICDLPACVYYTVDTLHRSTFHVPAHAVDAVLKKRIMSVSASTTAGRQRKYEARGYVYDTCLL